MNIKKVIHCDQMGLILVIHGYFNIQNLINAIHYNRIKEKTHMTNSIEAEKYFIKYNIHS